MAMFARKKREQALDRGTSHQGSSHLQRQKRNHHMPCANFAPKSCMPACRQGAPFSHGGSLLPVLAESPKESLPPREGEHLHVNKTVQEGKL